jgi:hypothetical protein
MKVFFEETLPGSFYRVDGSGKPRPTLMICTSTPGSKLAVQNVQ